MGSRKVCADSCSASPISSPETYNIREMTTIEFSLNLTLQIHFMFSEDEDQTSVCQFIIVMFNELRGTVYNTNTWNSLSSPAYSIFIHSFVRRIAVSHTLITNKNGKYFWLLQLIQVHLGWQAYDGRWRRMTIKVWSTSFKKLSLSTIISFWDFQWQQVYPHLHNPA